MFKGKYFVLIEEPQFYMGNPPLTIGKKYLVKDIDGSCFVIDDDEGNECRIGSCRFARLDLTKEIDK